MFLFLQIINKMFKWELMSHWLLSCFTFSNLLRTNTTYLYSAPLTVARRTGNCSKIGEHWTNWSLHRVSSFIFYFYFIIVDFKFCNLYIFHCFITQCNFYYYFFQNYKYFCIPVRMSWKWWFWLLLQLLLVHVQIKH